MNDTLATSAEVLGPLSSDWTVERLLEWIAEDDRRLSDSSLRSPLRAIDEAITGTRWTVELDTALRGGRVLREPAVVSLVRSIARESRRRPVVRAMTLAEVISPEHPARPESQDLLL